MPLTNSQRDWLALTLVPGVGTAMFIRLLARFRTASEVLRASRAALEEVVGRKLAQRISQYTDVADTETQERAMDKLGAGIVTLEDQEYPPRLAEIYDPPLVLFVRGQLLEQDEHCVAVVGTRRPTPYGVRMAERLGRELARRGITVVSGLAAGIDAAAHRGAIEGGGRTIAVLGNGVDVVYPQQHRDLMHDITLHGAVISQFPMGTQPSKGHFPYRNRIISGLTLGTVVVEAPLRSGALITARQAAEQGREVFAVPGQVGVDGSQGPHALIRDGARLVESAEDVLVELELPAEVRMPARPSEPTPEAEAPRMDSRPLPRKADEGTAAAAQPRSITQAEKAVLKAMSSDGSYVDEIAAECGISVSEALSSLTLLELKGLVRQFSGKRFAPR